VNTAREGVRTCCLAARIHGSIWFGICFLFYFLLGIGVWFGRREYDSAILRMVCRVHEDYGPRISVCERNENDVARSRRTKMTC